MHERNTFQYLSALQELDLLEWHSVDLKQRRMVWFITHWTATIREIAMRTGFGSSSYFTNCFKQHFGKSPREYMEGQQT